MLYIDTIVKVYKKKKKKKKIRGFWRKLQVIYYDNWVHSIDNGLICQDIDWVMQLCSCDI
jgi:hypothetical protein